MIKGFGLSGNELWLSRACKALGHPARLKILWELAQGDCMCGNLVRRLPLAQSTVSQHVKVLREAGLIIGSIEGAATNYRLDRNAVELLKQLMSEL